MVGKRWLPVAFGLAALAAAGFSLWPPAAGASETRGVAPTVLTQADIGARLRVFATPGDYKLENPHITAVVRKSDGWLTELWRNRDILPTVEQLGTTCDIDALWQLYPVVRIGKKTYAVRASRVALLKDGIEVEGVVDTGALRYRAVTVHRVAPGEARLLMTTTFSVDGGAPSGAVGFGDEFKWGNVQYYVDGVWPTRMKWEGNAAWIGRRGAGGDLMLRPLGQDKLWVSYGARIRGFQSAINTVYAKAPIAAGESISVSRALSFEPLPLPVRKPPERVGTLKLNVLDEAGRPLPAKVRFDRLGRKAPPFDDDGALDGADRFAWTGNGRLERPLEAGRYVLFVTSGIERDAAQKTVDVRHGRDAVVDVRLPRVIDTPGWIAADLHLHQAPSVDADISLPQRVISIAAEGVEFAVATDHYVVTDLAPTVTWLRERGILTRELQTLSGSEVSTLGHRFGHFNVFPLRPGTNVKYLSTTPTELFADARKQSPGGVVQVNHPRWDPAIGYFSYYGLDENTGVPLRDGYDANFDTLEVYNGDDARDLKLVKQVFADWLHLLGRGHRYAATGSSDSHKLAFLDPGLPRTMIRHGAQADDDTDVRAPSASILAALKAGRAVVTSGPILDVSVDGMGPGQTARGVGKSAKVKVRVQAAPWIDVRTVEVWVGGSGKRVHYASVPRTKRVLRLDKTFDVNVDGKSYVVVTAQGERGLPNASREATQPFAFTNPIWLEP